MEKNWSVQMVRAESICGEALFIWQWRNTKEFKPNYTRVFDQPFNQAPITQSHTRDRGELSLLKISIES